MRKEHLKNVRFDFIRYANCWEDADVLLEGLQIDVNSKIMSIASAGDNCFALLSANPQQVIAVDISVVQLFLVELKKIAIQQLNRIEFLAFMGFTVSNYRKETFLQIKNYLSLECLFYWEENIDLIENGIIHQGKFEQYFQLFKNEVLPTIHSTKIVDELFEPKSAKEQEKFHNQKWHTPAWKKMYLHFFGVEMMGEHGRDPEFLKHVKGSVPAIILAREMAHLKTVAAQKNYFLFYILNNTFNLNFLPFYVREENYENIKQNLNKLVLHKGLLGSAMDSYPNCTHFNLSDIFEYMDAELFKQVTAELIEKSAEKAVFGYWNLLIPRSISSVFNKKVEYLAKQSKQLKKKDLGYFYGDLLFEQKK